MILMGKRIKELRTNAKFTQKELADRLGVTKSTITAYENDSRTPSYDVLIKIARVFNVTIDSLLIDERKGIYFSTEHLTEEQVNTLIQLINVFIDDNLQCGRIDPLKKPEIRRTGRKVPEK